MRSVANTEIENAPSSPSFRTSKKNISISNASSEKPLGSSSKLHPRHPSYPATGRRRAVSVDISSRHRGDWGIPTVSEGSLTLGLWVALAVGGVGHAERRQSWQTSTNMR
jgi:hypothetical protein